MKIHKFTKIHRFTARAVVFAALLVCGAGPALAHAQLRSANPSAGSGVPTAPAEVVVSFTETLEPAFSTVLVRDAAGKRVDKGDSHLDQGDPTTMRVSLPAVANGVYTVEWKAVSADTHRTQGRFIFRVGE